MLNSSQNPLKVALLNISPHNRAILEFFFAGAGRKIFQTVATEQAEALIVDFDHPGARQEWQELMATSSKPAIVLSVKEPEADNIIWVSKPLTSQALATAATKVHTLLPAPGTTQQTEPQRQETESNIASLRALLDTQSAETRPFGLDRQHIQKVPPIATVTESQPKTETLLSNVSSVSHAPETNSARPKPEQAFAETEEQIFRTEDVFVPAPLTNDDILASETGFQLDQDSDAADPIKLEQRWNRLCGFDSQRIDADNWQESPLLYTPENYLLNNLVDALKLSHESRQYVQVKIDDRDYALLMPDVNLAYLSMDIESDDFAELCDTPLETGRVELHLPSTGELTVLEETIQHSAERTVDMEALIWTTSLLTSSGRLNRNADLNQRIRLRYWPNLTRLEQFPHTMQIAAAWHQRPGTVFEVSNWLDIPQRYVIAFYNASHTLSLFAVDHGKPKHKEKAAPRKNRGLFSRLLKRLLGGGTK